MFQNFYTTKMSAKGNTLQMRFMKMRRTEGRFSRIMGAIAATAVVMGLACALVACAVTDGRKTAENAITNLDFSEQELKARGKRELGSTMADIAYAGDDVVIVYYLDGIFIYDLNETKLVRSFDLNKLNCAQFQQGSYGLAITVSADGKTALLSHYGDYDEGLQNYRLDLEKGIAYETEEQALEHPAGGFAESFGTVPEDGWLSARCMHHNGKLYYLTVKEGWHWENIRLVQLDEASGEKRQRYVFGDADPALSEVDQIHSVLPEGAEIMVNSGVGWHIRIRDDAAYPEFEARAGMSVRSYCHALGIAYEEYKGRQLDVYVYTVEFGDGSEGPYLYVFDNGRLITAKDMRGIAEEQDLIRALTYLEEPKSE